MSDDFFDSDPERMVLGKLVAWVGGAMQGYYRRAFARYGATGTAIAVLGSLGFGDGPSQRELAGRVGLTPATLTPVLDGLERDGHIRRERDPADRRILRIHLTDAGEDYLKDVFTRAASGFRDRMPHPSPDQERIIREYLLAVLAAVTDDSRCPDGPDGADRAHSANGADEAHGAELRKGARR